jgi:hypothetical protein
MPVLLIFPRWTLRVVANTGSRLLWGGVGSRRSISVGSAHCIARLVPFALICVADTHTVAADTSLHAVEARNGLSLVPSSGVARQSSVPTSIEQPIEQGVLFGCQIQQPDELESG